MFKGNVGNKNHKEDDDVDEENSLRGGYNILRGYNNTCDERKLSSSFHITMFKLIVEQNITH